MGVELVYSWMEPSWQEPLFLLFSRFRLFSRRRLVFEVEQL